MNILCDMRLKVSQEQSETRLYTFFPNSFFVPFMLCKVKLKMGDGMTRCSLPPRRPHDRLVCDNVHSGI